MNFDIHDVIKSSSLLFFSLLVIFLSLLPSSSPIFLLLYLLVVSFLFDTSVSLLCGVSFDSDNDRLGSLREPRYNPKPQVQMVVRRTQGNTEWYARLSDNTSLIDRINLVAMTSFQTHQAHKKLLSFAWLVNVAGLRLNRSNVDLSCRI